MIIEVTDQLVINYRSIERVNGKPAWCELPYPDHPKGCPNYERCRKAPRVENYFDLSKPHWLAIVTFDLYNHVSRMMQLHPHWSERQCRCVLYWQGKVKSALDKICLNWIESCNNPKLEYHKIPEAMGVNVIKTLRRWGCSVEIKPKNIVLKVALIAERR